MALAAAAAAAVTVAPKAARLQSSALHHRRGVAALTERLRGVLRRKPQKMLSRLYEQQLLI
eukprot:4802240-Pleurochrysis_carterae.AAC.1